MKLLYFNNEIGFVQQRLDTLAEAGLPIWATELDVVAQDANKRADLYEIALKALYAHPSVEGIMFWGFWDQSHWRGEKASLVTGSNLEVSELITRENIHVCHVMYTSMSTT